MGGASGLPRSAVEGAADDAGAAVACVGVDHDRAHVFVARQFSNGADVVAVFQRVGGERMPERAGGDGLLDLCGDGDPADGSLNDSFVQVGTANFLTCGICVGA
jgi:hypothetical protein